MFKQVQFFLLLMYSIRARPARPREECCCKDQLSYNTHTHTHMHTVAHVYTHLHTGSSPQSHRNGPLPHTCSVLTHTHTKARTLDGYHWIDATWHLVSTGMWWEGGGMAGWGAAVDSQEHRSRSLHLWDPLFKYSDPRGLCPSASPHRSRETLTVRGLMPATMVY